MAVLLLLVATSYYFIDPIFVTVAQNSQPETRNLRENESSFNLWWLVPLLLIPPILYFLARAGDEEDRYDDNEFMPGINTGRRTSSGFEKTALSPAYYSEIKREGKKKVDKGEKKSLKRKKNKEIT